MKIKSLFVGLVSFACISFLFSQPKEITLEDIWAKYLFSLSGVSGFTPMPKNNALYTVKNQNGIDAHAFKTGEKMFSVLTESDLRNASDNAIGIRDVRTYRFDKNEQKILLSVKLESIYRRSSKAFYYIFDRSEKTLISLSDTAKGKQSFASFSPDGNQVAFVRGNNIFIKTLSSNEEIQVTADGKFNHIINGMADWVYEEELDMAQAFWWSPDGKYIAFLRFDESRVKEFSMTMWGNLYPEEYRYKYPKAGEDNSLVDVFLYDVSARQNRKIDMGDNSNSYIPRLYWLPNAKELVILKMNRHQNQLDFYAYQTITSQKRLIYTDQNKAWLDVSDQYYFLKDNARMIVTSERNGYNHLYMVDFGGKITPITSGEWEVLDVCAVDEKKQLIYYLSNEENVLQCDLYQISFSGKNKKRITNGKGWNTPTFNNDASFFSNVYSDIHTPPLYTLHDHTGKQLRTLQDNAVYAEKMKEYGFSEKELITVPLSDITLYGWMIKPKDFDSTKKYPVLMYVYGGPGSRSVNNAFSRSLDFAWYQLLAQKGYIVVCVDNRGTGGRGDDFKKIIYKQMGKYESDDQIAVAKHLKTLPYVDNQRVGIWGWSFGGYLSSLCLMKGEGVFKMAMAVAPVTNWRYYDNIYTERFLQTPQENSEGYDENSPIFHVEKLQGNYLLVHGTADDNVHFQNAVDLVSALNNAGKQYEQFFYPNKNHFIMGGNTRLHLYTKLTDFILKNL